MEDRNLGETLGIVVCFILGVVALWAALWLSSDVDAIIQAVTW
jgi:hypothetical protein